MHRPTMDEEEGEDGLDDRQSAPTNRKLILFLNRGHRSIEFMHRDRDVTLGKDRHTNRLDHAPRNVSTLLGTT